MLLHFTLDLLRRLKSSRNVLEGRNVFVAVVPALRTTFPQVHGRGTPFGARREPSVATA